MNTAEKRSRIVLGLRKKLKNAPYGTNDRLMISTDLEIIARLDHAHDCALGSVPACTCGVRNAKEILNGNFNWE